VIGVDGADVAPIGRFLLVFIAEAVGEDAIFLDDARKNILAEIVRGRRVFSVRDENRDEELRVEQIDAHRGVRLVGMNARGLGLGGLLFESNDAPLLVSFNNAEFPGGVGRIHFNRGDGDVGAGLDVLFEHFLVVHLVNVVAREDEYVVGLLVADRVDVLVDGVGGAEIPVLRYAHLRRQDLDEIADAHERRPAAPNMAVEAQRFVLREHEDAAQVAIEAIRERDVHDAVDASEGNGRFGAVARERPEPFALAARQENADRIAHQRHELVSGSDPTCVSENDHSSRMSGAIAGPVSVKAGWRDRKKHRAPSKLLRS
jgi:hypothetical protein